MRRTIKPRHTIYAVICMALAAPFLVTSCDGDISSVSSALDAMYLESKGLEKVSVDSILRFSNKLNTYVTQNPSAKSDPLYPEIKQNLKLHAVHISITVNAEWDGEKFIDLTTGKEFTPTIEDEYVEGEQL